MYGMMCSDLGEIKMKIEVLIMQKDYQVVQTYVDLNNEATVSTCLKMLQSNGCIQSDHSYTVSCYGRRMKLESRIMPDDRIELTLPLPSDPMDRRRKRALNNKKR